MTKTPIYGLNKPDGTDLADIAVLNTNMDTVETQLDTLNKGKAAAAHKHGAADINSGILPATQGGTGAATLAGARKLMGLGDTTGALPIANGGTGATTAAAALAALGGSTSGHAHTATQVGLGNVPNVATNNQTPTFTAATALTGLTSGEKLSVSFGKLAKAVADLIAHVGNKNNPHGATAAQTGAVPTGRTVNGKALSANVVLGAVDVKTAAGKSVETALSEKVSKTGDTMSGVLTFSDTMSGSRNTQIIQWNGETHLRNTNPDSSDYCDLIISRSELYAGGESNGVRWTKKIASSTPPQSITIPYNTATCAPLTGGILYKTADNIVTLRLHFKPNTPILNGGLIATLPVGYRPKESPQTTGGIADSSDGIFLVTIYTDGRCLVTNNKYLGAVTNTVNVCAEISFIAG